VSLRKQGPRTTGGDNFTHGKLTSSIDYAVALGSLLSQGHGRELLCVAIPIFFTA
jgi:hypothetical protein